MAVTTFSFYSLADESLIVIPHGEGQRMISQNLSMSTESLLKAYMHPEQEQRLLAEMYVVGVLDSTEGKSWCGFKIASASAIQEQVYIALKKAVVTSPKKRASIVIESHLMNLLPCKGSQ